VSFPLARRGFVVDLCTPGKNSLVAELVEYKIIAKLATETFRYNVVFNFSQKNIRIFSGS
jgi:hypothetical protein